MTLDDLPEFLRELTEDYGHDYGTICHAVAAGAVAAAWAVEHSPAGGITGFQAGCVMWEFIRHWQNSGTHKPLRLVDYENMLYPQYDHAFEKTISPDTWKHLQRKARELLADRSSAASSVVNHWRSIADGTPPFGYRVVSER